MADDCETKPCDLCRKRQGGHKAVTGKGGIFVANKGGTYTCEDCLSPAQKRRLGDDSVEVWEVGSHGWLAPLYCWICHLSIEVYVDGEDPEREDPPSLNLTHAELYALARVEKNMDPVAAIAKRLVTRKLLRTDGVAHTGPFRIYYVVTDYGHAAINAHPQKAKFFT